MSTSRISIPPPRPNMPAPTVAKAPSPSPAPAKSGLAAVAPTGAEKLIRCLEREGVEHIFGLSGGAAMPMFDALVDSKIKLILVRHEQGATHMADGYARSTGKPGVVL
ncbi:MAG: thiamine pyrophosphate-binding protein, partial [Polyangia bacterium]